MVKNIQLHKIKNFDVIYKFIKPKPKGKKGRNEKCFLIYNKRLIEDILIKEINSEYYSIMIINQFLIVLIYLLSLLNYISISDFITDILSHQDK